MEKPSGFPAGSGGHNPSGFPVHGEERPAGGETWRPEQGGTSDNSVTEESGWIGSSRPKPGNGSAAASGGGGDKPWLGGGGKPTTLPQPSRPVAGVGGGNEQPEGASGENSPDQARPLPDHSSNGGTQGDERPGGGTGAGLGVRPTVPGAQGSSEAWSTGGEETNLGTAVGPGLESLWSPEGTAQHPDINGETIENNVQSTGPFGGNPVRPSGPTTGTSSNFGTSGGVSDGAPESIAGNPDHASGSLDGRPQGTHERPQGTHVRPQGTQEVPQGTEERPQGTQGRPITNPGTQEETPGVPGGILGRPEATPTGPAGSLGTPVGSSGTSQGSSGALGGSTGSPDGSLGSQNGISGVSNQGSGSPSGSLGTLGAESGSPGVFGEEAGGSNNWGEEHKKPWSGGVIGEDGQSLLDGVESIHNSSHNIVNIFSENENVSIFSENDKLEDFESTIEALAAGGNSTVSNGLKAAILNYMPSLKWLFVFIDN